MAYRFIEDHQKTIGTRWLLNRMGLYPNGYYNYLKKNKASYLAKKEEILREIKNIYHEFGGILCHRSMRVFLARKQIFLSKNTVHNYMNKALGLHCICRCKRPAYPKGHAHKVFTNLIKQNFTVSQVNRVWCAKSDSTFRPREPIYASPVYSLL